MKPQQAVLKETTHIAAGTLVMGALMLIVYLAIGRFDLTVLFGALYGCALAVGNFFFLGMTVQRIAETAKADDADELKLAKLRMRKSYMLRMLLGGGLLVLAVAVLKLNWVCACLPLVFPRITITLMDVYKRIRSIKGSEIK